MKTKHWLWFAVSGLCGWLATLSSVKAIPPLPFWLNYALAVTSLVLGLACVGKLDEFITIRAARKLGGDAWPNGWGGMAVTVNQHRLEKVQKLYWIPFGLWLLPALLGFIGAIATD